MAKLKTLKSLSVFSNRGVTKTTIPILDAGAGIDISMKALVKVNKKRGYVVERINYNNVHYTLMLLLRFIREGSFSRKVSSQLVRKIKKRVSNLKVKSAKNSDKEQLKLWLNEFKKLPVTTDLFTVVEYALRIECAFEFGVLRTFSTYRPVMKRSSVSVMQLLEGFYGMVVETLIETSLDDVAWKRYCTHVDKRFAPSVLEKIEPCLADPSKRKSSAHTETQWIGTLEELHAHMEDDEGIHVAGSQSFSALSYLLRATEVVENYLARYPFDMETLASDGVLNPLLAEHYKANVKSFVSPVAGRSIKMMQRERASVVSLESYSMVEASLNAVLAASVAGKADNKFASHITEGVNRVGIAQNHAVLCLAQLSLLILHSLLGEDESFELFNSF